MGVRVGVEEKRGDNLVPRVSPLPVPWSENLGTRLERGDFIPPKKPDTQDTL